MTTTTPALGNLPAVRRARAELLLQEIGDRTTYGCLARALVREYRGDHRDWTATQLERAIDDLAAAGLMTVAPSRYGDLTIERLSKEVHS